MSLIGSGSHSSNRVCHGGCEARLCHRRTQIQNPGRPRCPQGTMTLDFFLIDYYYYFVCCVCVLSWHELASYLWLSLQSKPVAWLQSIQEAIACVCVCVMCRELSPNWQPTRRRFSMSTTTSAYPSLVSLLTPGCYGGSHLCLRSTIKTKKDTGTKLLCFLSCSNFMRQECLDSRFVFDRPLPTSRLVHLVGSSILTVRWHTTKQNS